ncbi:MAG: 3'(2'),5'-bisphosphate nucleotidase CysQ [Alphaproteobacteria bacterium]|nr:3'(2'),5'-bisphosphate nucleotidase CysQ [Alphaproteobacteria bacterium]
MAPEPFNQTTNDLRSIARRAGDAIMAIAASSMTVDRKADQSPVTTADTAANNLIVTALNDLTPDIPVVSEEGAKVLDEPDRPFWLVDPLDGTKEFIAGNGEFTVNIALIEQRNPTHGVIYAPATDRMFFSCGPGQVFQQLGTEPPVHLKARIAEPGSLVALASRSHLDERTKEFLSQHHITNIQQMGSSLKLCLIAAGEADIYPRFGPTMEWDTAAGHAILIAAGGSLTTPNGRPLRYAKPGLRNPDFIARGAAG